MLVQCKACGAPLDVKEEDIFVTCRYCDRTSRVRSMHTIASSTPEQWKPPKQWEPPKEAPTKKKAKPLPYHRGLKHKITEGKNPVSCAGCSGFLFLLVPFVIQLIVNPAFREAVAGPLALLGGADASAPPSLGTAELAEASGSRSWSGMAGGAVDAHRIGAQCTGYVPSAPHLVLRTTQPTQVVATTDSTADLVMAIRASDGTAHCDDDSAERRQPLVDAVLPAGDHALWVGTLSSGESPSFTLELDWQKLGGMPGPDGLVREGAPSLGTIDLSATADGQWSGKARGTVDGATIAGGCRGAFERTAHLLVRAAGPTLLTAETRSREDLVMLLASNDGTTTCDDDSGSSRQPRIVAPLAAGEHRVWVGTFRQNAESPFELVVRSRPLSAIPGPDGIAPDADPSVRTIELAPTSRREHIEGTTSGAFDVARLGQSCRGHVDPAPQIAIVLAEPTHLDLRGRSRADTTFVVRHTDGQTYCDDDSGPSNNPRVQATFPAGTVRVWVGTFQRDQDAHFTIDVTPSAPR